MPARVRRAELDAYLANVVEREFPEQGYPVRKPEVLREWLAAYAAATANATAYTTFEPATATMRSISSSSAPMAASWPSR